MQGIFFHYQSLKTKLEKMSQNIALKPVGFISGNQHPPMIGYPIVHDAAETLWLNSS